MKAFLISSAVLLLGCGGGSYVHSDTTLGRVIVYRNGVAYFERAARIDKDRLSLSVPADKVDDFLKSLTVVDARTGESSPIEYPTQAPSSDTGLIEMNIRLLGPRPHQVKLSYVTEAPAWKPSYRVTLDKAGKVKLEGLAIIDNTSGEDWSKVALGVASSSALSFRFDLRSVRFIQRESLTPSDMFAVAPPLGGSPYGGEPPGERGRALSVDLSDEDLGGAARYLPRSEQLVQSTAALSRIDAARTNVRRMLEIARRERDVVKTLCLNDKLVQLDVDARSAGERKASLERAASGNDVDVASHEFTVISVLRRRADQLAAEANECIGAEAAFVGETRVTTTIDPNLPPEEGARRAAPLPNPSPRAAQPPAREPPPPPLKPPPQKQDIESIASRIKAGRRRVVIEGYAGERDGDKASASLDRASKVRDQLIQRGVEPDRIAAVGKGVQAGHGPGVRLVELPSAAEEEILNDAALAEKAPGAAPPIGAAHFESPSPMSVAHGASTMVSMFKAETDGEIVYLYDRESARGNEAYPFRAVRLRNPTGEALESGPVTVFGEGRFIGEGLSEPIPARSVAFVPFSLDRQIVAQRKETERDEIARVLSARRGVFSVEVRHIRRASVTLHNRLAEPVTVYVRHTVAPGFELGAAPASRERIGAAYLFRVALPASGDAEVAIEESTPQSKVIDVRQEAGMALWRAYLTTAEAAPARKQGLRELLQRTDEIDELEQRIATTREQMKEYRERTGELSQQVVSLRAVSAKGGASGPLIQHLEQALRETSDRLSQATIELVSLEEKRMVARIRREEALSQASLSWKGSASGNDGQR